MITVIPNEYEAEQYFGQFGTFEIWCDCSGCGGRFKQYFQGILPSPDLEEFCDACIMEQERDPEWDSVAHQIQGERRLQS